MGEGVGAHTAWQVSTTDLETSRHCRVQRRYNDFLHLRFHLSEELPGSVVPLLPEKNAVMGGKLGTALADGPQKRDFMEERRLGLQAFLVQVCEHETLQHCEVYRLFLEATEADWGSEMARPATVQEVEARIRRAGMEAGV